MWGTSGACYMPWRCALSHSLTSLGAEGALPLPSIVLLTYKFGLGGCRRARSGCESIALGLMPQDRVRNEAGITPQIEVFCTLLRRRLNTGTFFKLSTETAAVSRSSSATQPAHYPVVGVGIPPPALLLASYSCPIRLRLLGARPFCNRLRSPHRQNQHDTHGGAAWASAQSVWVSAHRREQPSFTQSTPDHVPADRRGCTQEAHRMDRQAQPQPSALPTPSSLPHVQPPADSPATRTSRRGFLRAGLAVGGAGAIGAGLVASAAPAFAEARHGGLTRGDAAILRFLSAAEILETDLWQQYNELGGIPDSEVPGGSGNTLYTADLKQLDGDMDQYIHDNTEDEMSHFTFINAYLLSKGADPVNLERFRTLTGSQATGAQKDKKRLTNLLELTVDTSWWTRYRSRTKNPDLGDSFAQAIPGLATGRFRAIPKDDADTAGR